MGPYTTMAVDMLDFFERQVEWSSKTFGSAKQRGPIGPLKHLKKEAEEAIASIACLHDRSKQWEEIADCVILVFEAAWRSGMSYSDISKQCMAKLRKNRDRVWPSPPEGDEPIEHDRSSEPAKPKIVCLCGSTRFKQAWYDETKRLTHEGKIVLGVGDLNPNHPNTNVTIDADLKERLDELHKRKIDLADEVFILNVGRYVGDSTKSEIEYAMNHGKPLTYLEPL